MNDMPHRVLTEDTGPPEPDRARPHRVFLDCSQSRRGLAGADDARLVAADRRHHRRGRGRDAAEMAEEVESGPLGGQKAASRAAQSGDDLSRR